MSNLGYLLKINFQKFAGGFRKKQKKNAKPIGVSLIALFAVLILAFYSFQAWSMFKGLAPVGLSQICVFHACLITVNVLVILAVMRSVGKKKQTDNLLLAMPIKKVDIVLANLIGTYLLDLFFTFTLLMPFVIIFMCYEGFSLSMLLLAILLVFVLPLFSVGLTQIMNFLIRQVFNKSKYGNFYKSLISVAILTFALLMIFLKTFNYGNVQSGLVLDYFNDRPITECLAKILLNRELVSTILVVLICGIVFALGVALNCVMLNKETARYVPKKKEVKVAKQKSLLGYLLKKELTNYLTTPVYVSNTIIGPVMLIILSIVLSSMGLKGIEQNLNLVLDSEGVCGLVILVSLFSLSTAIISCSTISLEGKNFWILKSTPINEKIVLASKCLLQIVVTLPAIIISGIVSSIAFKFSALECALCFLLPCVFTLLLSCLGVLVNLIFPKLEFTEETQVVKQSVASLLTMFGGMVLALVPLVLFLWASKDIMLVGLISACIYLALLGVSLTLLFTYGVNKFRKLQ